MSRSAKVRRQKAVEGYSDITEYMQELRGQLLSLSAIAEHLNADGHTTRRGKSWNKVQVKRVLDRIAPR